LKSINKILLQITLLTLLGITGNYTKANSFVLNPSDSLVALTQYSLFSEYHKNRDYHSALPYGWKVIEMDPKRFAKWIYYKMEDCLWYLHDSSNVSPEEIQAIEDTIIHFYNLAIENYPDQKGYFQSRKAFVSETWLGLDDETVIKEYELAFTYDPNLSSYYYNRLGQLYKANMDDEANDYKQKALDLYVYLSEIEPDNPQWSAEQENLVENIDELVDLLKKAWDIDPENPEKAWKFASTAIKANRSQEAIPALVFLVSKNPESSSYLNQLASAYHKTDNLSKAEEIYKKLIQIESDKKEHYYNLGLIYKDKGQLSAARSQFEKASEVGGGWAAAIFNIGLLYEQSARGCGFEFEDKLVYQLAVDTYRRARNMDASFTQAQDRINALSSSIPTQEDYFFRGYKSGQVIQINGRCYGWIGKSVTVP
jgi:tetratricopeptide (TPR) repeat protein